MFVDKLRKAIAAEQNAEAVEPGDDALQLDAIDQKYCYRHLMLTNMIEKRVLKVLQFSWAIGVPAPPVAKDVFSAELALP